MSQIYKSLTSGSLPPSVPTEFDTQLGNAVPAANILIVNGFDSTENNVNGIITKGGVVGTGTANEVDVIITNRLQGTVTTANATPTTVISFPLGATPGLYTFDVQIAGYDTTDAEGVGYFISGSVRTTGAAAVVIGTPDKVVNEEASPVDLTPCDANLTVSANNALIQVTGIAAKNIDWNCVATYVFVS